MIKSIVCAGLGGQGVLTAGKLIMYAAYDKDYKVTWFPSYGNEMRGGNANCNVIISDEKISSPYADHPDILFAMSESAVDLYMEKMASGGVIYANASLIPEDKNYREDVKVVKVDATDIAIGMKSEQNANLCLLGKLASESDLFTYEEFEASMCNYFESAGKGKYNEKNKEVLKSGSIG